jgi:hypothetical protein
MRRFAAIAGAAAALVLVPAALAEHGSAWPAPPGPVLGPGDSVPICHATGSATNPFVANHPSSAGVLNGHFGADHQGGEDIIPPFQFQQNANSDVDTTASNGQNWDAEGQAIWADECELAGGGGGGTTTGGTTTGGTTTGGTTTGGTTGGGGGAGAGGGGGGASLGTEAAGEAAGQLPFTGLPVWIVLLAGLGLIGGGLGMLRLIRADR